MARKMKRTTNISSGALLCGSLLVFSVLIPTVQQSFIPIVYAQELPSSSDIINVAGKDDESPEADAGPREVFYHQRRFAHDEGVQ